MKKLFYLLFVVLFALCLVACGESGNEQPTENVSEKAREFLNEVTITYSEGDSQTSVTKDITLVAPQVEGVAVTWTSDDDAIKIEGTKGVVTRSLEEDIRVKITATLTYKEVSLNKPFSLKVLADEPQVILANQIVINGTPELEEEDEVLFTATVLPSDAADKAFTWSSSNEAVASVEPNGLVTALGEGTCNIIATLNSDDKVYAEFEVIVNEKLNLCSLADALLAETGTKVKVRAGIIAANAQGYLLYDETAYVQYYLGSGATIDYNVEDQLEIIGVLSEYNGNKQFTKDAIVTKLGSGYTSTFNEHTYDAETIAPYYGNEKLGDNLVFDVTITNVSDSFVNATINGIDGYGIAIAYPAAKDDFVVGKNYKVYGYALYTKEYQNVKYFYMMASKYGQIYTITFDTTYEATVEPIQFIDIFEVDLPELHREEYIFVGWMDGESHVEQLTENKDYTLVADFLKREYEAPAFELAGGDFEFDKQFFIGNYNNCNGINSRYDCFTIHKKGGAIAWASQFYLKFFMKEVEPGSNVYKIVYKAGESVAVEGDLLKGITVDFDYIISSNATNSEGHPYFVDLYYQDDVLDNYFYFVVPENCPAKCNIKVVYDLERAKVDPNNLKFEQDDKLPGATRTGYDFGGWYDNATFTGEPCAFHVKGVTKYYGKWEPTTYEVTFELDEGTTTATLPTTYNIETEDIVLPTADAMSKTDHTFLGWYDNPDGNGTPYATIAKGTYGELKLYAVWQSNFALEKQVSEADVKVLNRINATKYVFSDAKICSYIFKGTGLDPKYEAEINVANIYNSLENAIKDAVEGDVIYLFAGTTGTYEKTTIKDLSIISSDPTTTIVTFKANVATSGNIYFDGITLDAGNGVSFNVNSDNVTFTVKNSIVDWYNTFYTCYDDFGEHNVLVFDNVKFERARQFIAWITLGESVSVTNCSFDLSNGKLGTIGTVGYNTALFRIRAGKTFVFNNNYVTGTLPSNPFIIEYTVAGGTLTAMYNTFADTTAPIYMNAAGTATYNKNVYTIGANGASAPTIASKIQNGAVLNLDTEFYGSTDALLAARLSEVSTEFLADFNTKVGKNNTADTFDSEHMDGSDLVGFITDATYGAKWAWLIKAIYDNCGQLAAADPAAAGQDYSAYEVKGFYIVNIKAFLTGATQHDKNFNVDSVAMTADIQKAILNAKAN